MIATRTLALMIVVASLGIAKTEVLGVEPLHGCMDRRGRSASAATPVSERDSHRLRVGPHGNDLACFDHWNGRASPAAHVRGVVTAM